MDNAFNLRSTGAANDHLFVADSPAPSPTYATRPTASAGAEARPLGKKRLWAGRIVTGLTVAFLLFDSIPKILEMAWVVKASTALGFPAGALMPIGVVLLACTILYCIPRTAILGAILLTGYLGGAVEANVQMGAPLVSNVLFPIYFAVLVWGGLALRDRRVWRIFDRAR